MMSTEQILTTHKANAELLFGLCFKAFEGVERLIELNVQTAKAAMTEAADAARAALSVKDAQELLALQTGFLQPVAEKAAAYTRHVYEIAVETNVEVTKILEATASESQAKFLAAVGTAVKNAPAGTENAVAIIKSAVAAATNAYEGVQKAAKQAADVAEANFQALSATAARGRHTNGHARRAAA